MCVTHIHAHTLEKQKLEGEDTSCTFKHRQTRPLGRPVPSRSTAPDLPLLSLLLSQPLLALWPPLSARQACSVTISLPPSGRGSLTTSQKNVPPVKCGVPALASGSSPLVPSSVHPHRPLSSLLPLQEKWGASLSSAPHSTTVLSSSRVTGCDLLVLGRFGLGPISVPAPCLSPPPQEWGGEEMGELDWNHPWGQEPGQADFEPSRAGRWSADEGSWAPSIVSVSLHCR